MNWLTGKIVGSVVDAIVSGLDNELQATEAALERLERKLDALLAKNLRAGLTSCASAKRRKLETSSS
jgi:hypothetical protein